MTLRRNLLQTTRFALLAALLLTALGGASANTPPFEYGDYQRIDATADGTVANNSSYQSTMSGDGNLSVFYTSATNLTPEGQSGYMLHDRRDNSLRRLDIATDQNFYIYYDYPRLSRNGRYLLYTQTNASGPDYSQVWRYDVQNDTQEPISVDPLGGQPQQVARTIDISADGRYIAFMSDSTSLVADMTGCNPLFIRDTLTDTTVCVPMGATQETAIDPQELYIYPTVVYSADGSTLYFVASSSEACCFPNQLFVYDIASGITAPIDVTYDGAPANDGMTVTAVSADGSVLSFAAFASTNIVSGVAGPHILYFYDRSSGEIATWDAFAQGVVTDVPSQCMPYGGYRAGALAFSASKRYVWGVVLVYAVENLSLRHATVAQEWCDWSGGPLYINFVYNRQTNTTTTILPKGDEIQIGSSTYITAVSDDGQVILFESADETLIPNNPQGYYGVFLGFNQSNDPEPTITELLVNGNFEDNDNGDPLLPDGWRKVGPLKFDRVRTDTQTQTFAHSAPNAFQLRGTQAEVGVTSKLVRNARIAGVTFAAGETLTFSAMVDARTGIAGTTVARAVVKYANGTQQVLALKLPKPAVVGYTPVSVTRALKRADVKAITVELFYNKPTGRLLLDDVSLKHTTIPTTPPVWTPLPAPAN
jgi:hypothetical protein